MRSRHILLTMVVVVALATGVCAERAHAAGPSWSETVNVYTYSVGGTISWDHQASPYDITVYPVVSATLTIVADDVDDNEDDLVRFRDPGGTWHNLGYLNDMGFYTNWAYQAGAGNTAHPDAITTTTLTVDPSWIDGNQAEIQVEVAWGTEIETATLAVEHTPELPPSALLCLGSLPLGLAYIRGWRRKKE